MALLLEAPQLEDAKSDGDTDDDDDDDDDDCAWASMTAASVISLGNGPGSL